VSAKENLNVEKTFVDIAKTLHADRPRKEESTQNYQSQKLKAPPKQPVAESEPPAPPPKKSCCQ
jgi:hypothetical protein